MSLNTSLYWLQASLLSPSLYLLAAPPSLSLLSRDVLLFKLRRLSPFLKLLRKLALLEAHTRVVHHRDTHKHTFEGDVRYEGFARHCHTRHRARVLCLEPQLDVLALVRLLGLTRFGIGFLLLKNARVCA